METEKNMKMLLKNDNQRQIETEKIKTPTNFTCIKATEDDSNRRIDRVIRKFLPCNIPLSAIYSSFRKGLIKLNGKKTQQDKKIFLDDEIWIHNSLFNNQNPVQDFQIKKQTQKIFNSLNTLSQEMILFQSKDILIINKPSGMSVHGGEGINEEDTATFLVLNDYEKKHGFTSLSFKPGPLHRIDKATSGLVIFSQSLKGANEITTQIKEHRIRKIYLAVARGKLQKAVWEDNLLKTENQSKVQISNNGKYAKTTVLPILYNSKTNETLATFEIETGRTHQIRVQSSIHGHPLSNDTIYDINTHSSKNTQKEHNFFLHAWKLFFPKETKIECPESLTAPLSKDFKKYCEVFFPDWENIK